MSIGAVTTDPWFQFADLSAASQTDLAVSSNGLFSPSDSNGPLAAAGGSGTNTPAPDPLTALSQDIQALLLQTQAVGGTIGLDGTDPSGSSQSGSSQSGSVTSAVSPVQQLTTDMQTVLSDLENVLGTNNPATNPTTTANANPTDGTNMAPHHHHHHHGQPGEANGASAVAGGGQTSGAAGGSQQVSVQLFAVDITQASLAYGGGAASGATQTMTV